MAKANTSPKAPAATRQPAPAPTGGRAQAKPVRIPKGYASALDIKRMNFDTISLDHEWGDWFGEVSRDVRMGITADPGGGKSVFGMDFANYLAKNFGPVLYVASEEGGVSHNVQSKIMWRGFDHPNLIFGQRLPSGPEMEDFFAVFVDSIQNAGLETMEKLKRFNDMAQKTGPKLMFYVFQETKGGKFRGSREMEHYIDVKLIIKNEELLIYGRCPGGIVDLSKRYGIKHSKPRNRR